MGEFYNRRQHAYKIKLNDVYGCYAINGWRYTDLDASQAIASGIGVIQRQGDLANKIIMDYGNNFNSSYTAQDLDSQAEYGLFAEQFNSYLKNAADVEDVADRLIGLRAWPRNTFQSITFALLSACKAS